MNFPSRSRPLERRLRRAARPAADARGAPAWECRTVDGFRWRGERGALATLLAPERLPPEGGAEFAAEAPAVSGAAGPIQSLLARWRSAGRLTEVKVGPKRSVHRLQLDGESWYLKHDHSGGWWKSIRHACGYSAARREWNGICESARRGVPTVEPILFAESSAWRGESVLVTRGLDDHLPLERFLAEEWPALPLDEQDDFRRGLALALGDLAACMHSGGVEHPDFQGGNLLVDPAQLMRYDDCDAAPPLVPIDLAAVRLHAGPLPWLVGLRHWGTIGTSLRYDGDLMDRLRALSRFRSRLSERLAEAPTRSWFAAPGRPARKFIAQAQAAVESNHLLWQGRHERRSCRPGKVVRAIQEPQWQGWCSQTLSLREEKALRDDTLAWLRSLADEWRDRGVRRMSRMRMTASGPQRAEFQVRIDSASGWEAWGGPERRRWKGLHRLALRRVAGPQPWLLARVPLEFVDPSPPDVERSQEWVVIEVVGVPEDRAAFGALQRRISTLHPDKRAMWRSRLVDAAALWAARQHDAGVLLTLPAEQALVVAVSVGKLELQVRHAAYVQFRSPLSNTEIAADLAAWFERARPWSFPPSVRRAFLRRYLQYRLLPTSQWRELRRRIADAALEAAAEAVPSPARSFLPPAAPSPSGSFAASPPDSVVGNDRPLPSEAARPGAATIADDPDEERANEPLRPPLRRSRPPGGGRPANVDALPPVG